MGRLLSARNVGLAAVALGALAVLGGSACAPNAGQAGPSVGPSGAAGEPDADPRPATAPGGVKVYGYEIVKTYPHDTKAYTQGLLFHGGKLYESTGRNGESTLRRVKPETGAVERRHDLPYQLFGEGLTLWKDVLVQLTWKAGKAIVYDRRNLVELYRKDYQGEGWGLTHDGQSLIMSDGSHELRFLDPKTFQVRRKLAVTEGGRIVFDLNELEYVEDEIWANVYQQEWILRIDPKTGAVTSKIDLRGLQRQQGVKDPIQDVLNGIAYDPQDRRIFITGKYWPNLYEIRLVERH